MDKVIPSGTKRLIKARGVPICLVRKDDELVAFLDSCPHMGESLYSGTLNRFNEVICPWHSYGFSLHTGDEVSARCKGLTFVKTIVEGEKTYLEI